MADGGTPNPQARRAPLPIAPPEASRAGDLASAQAQDRFASEQEGRPSPLELPQRSYAAQSTEAEQVKGEQERMAATGEQFLGAPVVPSMGPRPEAAPAGDEETGGRRQRRAGGAEEGNGDEEAEAARAAQLEQQRAASERQRAQQAQEAATGQQQQRAGAVTARNVAKQELKERIMVWIAASIPEIGGCCLTCFIILFIIIFAAVVLGLISGAWTTVKNFVTGG